MPDVRLCIRTTVAALAAFGIAEVLRLPQGYWAVLTAVIVMQGSIGGSVKASFDRLTGTIGGAVYGVALLMQHTTAVAQSDRPAGRSGRLGD